jgi:DNA-binding transcriptional regulator YhcF (GntR family)
MAERALVRPLQGAHPCSLVQIPSPNFDAAVPQTPKCNRPVYRRLKALVINYSFPPGRQLQIGRLAERLHVSSTPVREALNHLHAEDFVRSEGRGFFAKTLNLQEMQHLHELLFMLLRAGIMKGQTVDDTPALIKMRSQLCRSATIQVGEIESILDSILRLTRNTATIRVGANLIDRTHFVRALAFGLRDAKTELIGPVEHLAKKILAQERSKALISLEKWFSYTDACLPDVVKEGLIRQSASDP